MEFSEFIKTPMVDGVTLKRRGSDRPLEGTLCVSSHHLILSSRKQQHEEVWILHKNVDAIEKKFYGCGGTLTLKCKNLQLMQLEMSSVEHCLSIATSLEQLSNIDNINLAYPFFFRAPFEVMEDGWQAFLPETEFSRLKSRSDQWRLSFINRDYKVCATYPQAVIVPKCIDEEVLFKAAGFRHGGRFPVLSYYHPSNSMVIMRCSQPLIGPNGRRCKEDEKLVNAVLGIGRSGYILDTRSQTVTKLITAKGGGTEPAVHYPQWQRRHENIERFNNLHESFVKLIEACTDLSSSMDKWLSKLESSNWLSHIKDILNCACLVAKLVEEQSVSVLVHGTEGVDSTLQVTSLSQLLLDPDCRTIRGFEALIEREWLQAGHPFAERNAKSAFAATRNHQEAPVFLLFLDCVWQIWQQFPCSFEFNEDFLIFIFEHSYASQYGTFLGKCDKERQDHALHKKTVSLWSYVNRPEVLFQFMNPLYEPNTAVLWPSVAAQSLNVWMGLYQRWHKPQQIQRQLWSEIAMIKDHDKALKSKAIKLRKGIDMLVSNDGNLPL